MLGLLFVLLSGVIKEDFFVDEDSVKGFQINPVVAVAPNGNFAIAWEDSIPSEEVRMHVRGDVYIRFFDKEGKPVTPARRLNQDSLAGHPALGVDDAGRVACVWYESHELLAWVICGQVFDLETGEPLSARLNITDSVAREDYDVASEPDGGFFVVWNWDALWGQRYDSIGTPLGARVKVYTHSPYLSDELQVVDVNRQGWAAVAWRHLVIPLGTTWKVCFQIVDSANNVVIPDSFGLVCGDQSLNWKHLRPRVRWFDEDRFAVFWLKLLDPPDTIQGVQAKLFDANGDSLSEIRTVLYDRFTAVGTYSPLSVSSIVNGRYAVAYEHKVPGPKSWYNRAAGFIADTSLKAVTGIFRLSPTEPHYYQQEKNPCVDVSADRIVWVWQDNSLIRVDTFPYYTDVHCKITDWEVPAIDERPQVTHPDDFEIITSIGSEVVLRYFDKPLGLHAQVYDVTGRKVDELTSPNQAGILIWGANQNPGVYFIMPQDASTQPLKAIIVR